MQLVIKDVTVTTSQINGKSGVFQSSSQDAWLDLPSGERRKVRVRLQRDAKPYQSGSYVVSDESFTVGKYGDLEIGQLVLVPAPVAVSQAKAS